MSPVHQLALDAEVQFASLAGDAWELQSRRVFGEECSWGGFELEYRSSGRRLTLVYSDREFEAQVDGRVVFGPSEHPTFSGNMFSRENLAKYLSQILSATVNALA